VQEGFQVFGRDPVLPADLGPRQDRRDVVHLLRGQEQQERAAPPRICTGT
jgi:hypothetical protein